MFGGKLDVGAPENDFGGGEHALPSFGPAHNPAESANFEVIKLQQATKQERVIVFLHLHNDFPQSSERGFL